MATLSKGYVLTVVNNNREGVSAYKAQLYAVVEEVTEVPVLPPVELVWGEFGIMCVNGAT
jgi:hypothetical protein